MTRHSLRHSDAGASTVEYSLLAAAVAAIIVLVVFTVGIFTEAMFQDTCNEIDTKASATIQAASTCS